MEFKWQALYDRKRHFSNLIWPQGVKWKFRILTAHLQDIPYHILEYYLSTIWNLNWVQVTSLIWQKTSLFSPRMTPAGKMKIPNPYCTSKRHAQSYPRVSIVYFWKFRCSSSDKVYRKQEKSFFDPHLTPRGKMKIPKPYCAFTGHGQSSPRIS